MGNEGSIPSDSESQVSDWQSIYSYGSRAGRRSSLGSMRIPSPMDPPEPDLSHLSPHEVAQIREVIGRAKEMKDEENKRIRKLEEEYVTYTADVERRTSEVVASAGELSKHAPLCPICLKSELKIQEGKMTDGQNVCADCGNLTCLKCGEMEQSVKSKELEWVCHVCHKRRQLVLSSGLWHPGCDVDEEIPLSREVERRLHELETASIARGPLTRSTSVEGTDGHQAPCGIGSASLQRQLSLPDYHMPTIYAAGHALESIPESGFSDNVSEGPSPSPEPGPTKSVSPSKPSEMDKSTLSVASNGGSIRAIVQTSSRSESEYSDGVSDVDMEDASFFRSGTDLISPDEGSDDYSFMSIGSSDDNASLPYRRKHRPKSLNLSRSVSGTSSEDETSDSAISTDIESKVAGSQPPDPHELRIALAASAFVEEMRGVDMNNDTDVEVADISAQEAHNADKVRFSPSAPVSPSWREGLESPPFSPRRRDSYPGKRRGSSPVSPKDKRFTYTDISPPSRQMSLEELYDKEAHASNNDTSFVPFAQRPSPKSPDEMQMSFLSNSGEVLSFDRPVTNLKKSKPFYSLDDATIDINDTTTIMDLATYAATVATNTANLTSMSVSPTNIDVSHRTESPESLSSSSPASPMYDNVQYKDDTRQDEESEEDVELADPSQKSIDYQGSKRQKARPPTTDWSPVIDLSPILDVSPSLEEAEQAEMLAEQHAERERQASREDDAYTPPNSFVAIGDVETEQEYQYYGLKRYDVIEDINELVKQHSGELSPPLASGSSENNFDNETVNANSQGSDKSSAHFAAVNFEKAASNKGTVTKPPDSKPLKEKESASNAVNPDTREQINLVETKVQSKDAKPLDAVDSGKTPTKKEKVHRKLPEPNAEIKATQKPPVPKPRNKALPIDQPPQKPARASKSEPLEPKRNPPILHQSVFAAKQAPKPQTKPVKKNTEERRKTAKDMKAKPDPLIMSHLELEDASASPQYKVLDSPPSPETKAVIRREYSDSTSVSPSSSPDRESFLYPSPVTPPDSDSSPPKPHSPSSGTDFEDEFILVCDDSAYEKPKEKVRNASVPTEKRQSSKRTHENPEKSRSQYKEPAQHHSKSKQHSPQSKDHKQKEMKKVRRKLPPIPAEEEHSQNPQPKQRPAVPRKPPPRTDNRIKGKSSAASSTSDDSSMNEDDKEVASITRKKQINNLDKTSIDKRNGNYIKNASGIKKPEDYVEINIPPDLEMLTIKIKDDTISDTYHDETDAIIDSMINIYGAPITQAMKGLKRRLQDELRRVTEGRRRKIDEIEELRVLKFQLGELRIGSSNKSNLSGGNGKKRSTSTSRTSPQMINRRARHKRQSSDPMVAKFSPIKEDKDIESEVQIVTVDDDRSYRTADDSSQSGISDTDSARSEPIVGTTAMSKVSKHSNNSKLAYTQHAQSSETLQSSNNKTKVPKSSPQLISSHSDGSIPANAEDEELKQREVKRRELQYEIEKRRKQLAERESKLKEARSSLSDVNKQKAQSCDEISTIINIPSCIYPRPIPTGIIKPLDDETDKVQTKSSFQNQSSYSSTEYLAHKQEEIMRQRIEGLHSFSSPYLYNSEFGEKSAFVPQTVARANLDSYSYSTGNVNVSTRDKGLCSSATLPNMPISKADLENNNRPMSDTESSPPHIPTPAMPLLMDVKARSRKIIHEIGTGSRPVSAEFNLGIEDLMNGMYRVESDNSVDADEPIMKHLMEGGVTILKQLERRKQPPPSAPKKYDSSVKRILLSTDPKEKYGKGRPGNGVGMKIVGGKFIPGLNEVGAFVATIFKGGVADKLHGEVNEGDQILEWNGIELSGKSYEEVQGVISQADNGEVELVIKPSLISKKVLADTTGQKASCHSSYDNLESDEEIPSDTKARATTQPQGVDPSQLAATLEGIEEDESPCMSHSSSQHDSNTASASSGCSSPLSEPTSTSSDQRSKRGYPIASRSTRVSSPTNYQKRVGPRPSSNRAQYGSQGHLQTVTHAQDRGLTSSHSSSEYMNCSQINEPNVLDTKQNRNKSVTTISVEPPPYSVAVQQKSPLKVNKRQMEQSEKGKELNQQSNSFDDFIRISQHAGVDERQLSPSRKANKRGLSSSASELARRPSEDEIQKSPKGSSRGNRQMGDIQLQLGHDEDSSAFTVRVLQARNLLPMDFNGLSDPFVKLYLLPGRCSDNKRRTRHIPRTLNPEWSENVIFPDVHIEELRNKTLEVTVWDYDRFKANDFLGQVVIDFSEGAFLDNLPHWYPLCGHDDTKGLDIPQATVLPPKHTRANSVSPRAVTLDKQMGSRGERGRAGLGRRRRSFDTLQNVDKV